MSTDIKEDYKTWISQKNIKDKSVRKASSLILISLLSARNSKSTCSHLSKLQTVNSILFLFLFLFSIFLNYFIFN